MIARLFGSDRFLGVVTAVVGCAAAFGLHITPEQRQSVLELATVLAPIIVVHGAVKHVANGIAAGRLTTVVNHGGGSDTGPPVDVAAASAPVAAQAPAADAAQPGAVA